MREWVRESVKEWGSERVIKGESVKVRDWERVRESERECERVI